MTQTNESARRGSPGDIVKAGGPTSTSCSPCQADPQHLCGESGVPLQAALAQLPADAAGVGKMKIEQVDPCAVSIPRRLRAADPAKIKQIGESMAAMGLQQPITVWSPKDGDCELIAGAHRLQAAVDLGWDWIDVVFHDDWSEIDRQLWEIDENLMRAELNPTELGEHITRREKLWEERKKTGGRSSPTSLSDGRGAGPQHQKGFAADTTVATGMSKRTINEHLARTKAIPEDVRDQIKGTKLDTRVYLDWIKGMDPDDQRAKVIADLEEPKKPAPVVVTDPAEDALERLKRLSAALDDALKAAAPETRKQFRAWQAEIINADWRKSIEGIIQTGRNLAAAQAELSGGEFTKMIEADLPFSTRAAQQLMAIASDPAIANPNGGSDFPPGWAETVLAQLASLSAEDFEGAQARGLTKKRAAS